MQNPADSNGAPTSPAALPSAFRATGSLRWLNVAAVGLALAAGTGLLGELGLAVLEVPLSTLFYGLVWACLVRIGPRRGPLLGWLASLPLAAMNAGTALAVNELHLRGAPAASTFFMGASFGVVIWLPALGLTLLFFGLPLLAAEHGARSGIGGDDRGSTIVGATCAVYGVLMLLLSLAHGGDPGSGYEISSLLTDSPSWQSIHERGYLFWRLVASLGTAGFAAGAFTVGLGCARMRARRVFLDRVRRGAAPGYRIEPARPALERCVQLVRVTGADDYRATAHVEPLFDLDERGDARRAAS